MKKGEIKNKRINKYTVYCIYNLETEKKIERQKEKKKRKKEKERR